MKRLAMILILFTGIFAGPTLAHHEDQTLLNPENGGGALGSVYSIHEKYIANCTSNVRAGPSTRYHVIDQVRNRELVTVIGKVRGRNWYKVRVGSRIGYIYAPLLEPTYHSQQYYDETNDWYR